MIKNIQNILKNIFLRLMIFTGICDREEQLVLIRIESHDYNVDPEMK